MNPFCTEKIFCDIAVILPSMKKDVALIKKKSVICKV